MPELLPAGVAARANRALDPLHAMLYFAPETDEELSAVGLRPGRMCYFASRSAPMGPVPPAVTAATFYNFNPSLVAKYLPRAWTLASIEDILTARLAAADRVLRRLLGDECPQAPAIADAAALARTAAEGLPLEGRPLFAGHAALDWPDEPHLALWHAITLLREFRGDGHLGVLLTHQLSGVESLVTHTATGRGFTVATAKATRGWSDEQWTAAEDGLRARGLLDDAGLTPDGAALRESIEADTDRLAAEPWLRLDGDQLARLIELGKALSRTAVNNGAFPPEAFAATAGR